MLARISTIALLVFAIAVGAAFAGPAEDLARVDAMFRQVEDAARSVNLAQAKTSLREAGVVLDRLYQSSRSTEVLDRFATLRNWNERLVILENLESARAQLAEAQKRAGALGYTSQELLAVAERSIRGAQRSLAVPLASAATAAPPAAAPSPAAPPSAGPRRHDEVFIGPRRAEAQGTRPPEIVGMSPAPTDSQEARATVDDAWKQYVSRVGERLLPALPSPTELAAANSGLVGKAVHLEGIPAALHGLADQASWWFKTAQGAYVVLRFDRVVLATYGSTLVQGETVSFPDGPLSVVGDVKGLKKIIGDTGVPVDAVVLEVRALRTPLGFISEEGTGVTRPLRKGPEGFFGWLWWLVTRLFYLALILAGVLVLMIVLLLIYFKIDEWRYERQFANEEWETGTPPPAATDDADCGAPDCGSGRCACCGDGGEKTAEERREEETDEEAEEEEDRG